MAASSIVSFARFAFSVAVFWLCFEVLAMLLLPWLPEMSFQNDRQDELMPFHSARIWSPKPLSSFTKEGILYSHDDRGLRTHRLNKKPTLLGIGDSTMFGFGVNAEDTLLYQTASCVDTGLINGGISGYSSSQSLRLLSEILSQNEDIEWVVLSNLWSDLMRTHRSDDDFMADLDRLAFHQSLLNHFVFSKSPIIRLLSQTWFTYIKPLSPPLAVNRVLKGDDSGTLRRVSLAQYSYNIKSMIDIVRAHGAEPIILLLPSNESGLDETMVRYRLVADKLAYENGVNLVDMEKVFKQLPSEKRKLRFIDEVHPSVLGHAEIATELCNIVRPIAYN